MTTNRRLAYSIVSIALSSWTLMRAQTSEPSALLKEFWWRSIGPANMGVRVDDIEAVDRTPAIVYVGAATSGVWKTENNATTWTPVFDAQPNLSIGDIAIAPSNPDASGSAPAKRTSNQ